MKKWWIVVLAFAACLLLTVTAFAGEAELKSAAPENTDVEMIATGGSASGSKNVVADTKSKHLKRGTVLDLWWWNDSPYPTYQTKNGKEINSFTYTYYGSTRVKVTKGKAWLRLAGYATNWNWVMRRENKSNKTRDGQIQVTDSKGLVLTVNIHQSGRVKVRSAVKRGTNKAVFQVTKPTQTTGFAICDEWGEPLKLTTKKKLTITSSLIGLSKFTEGEKYTFGIAAYKKMGKKKIMGPATTYRNFIY